MRVWELLVRRAFISATHTQATMANYIQLISVIEEEHPSSEDAYLVGTPRSPMS